MRTILGLLFVAMLVGVAMPTHAQSEVVFDFEMLTSTKTVDLVQGKGGKILFEATNANFGMTPAAAFVTLTCAEGTAAGQCPDAETIVVGMANAGGNGNWVGQLSIDNRDLVKGSWTVVATGQSSDSTSVLPKSGSFKLDVTAPTTAPPLVYALNLNEQAGYIAVAKNQQVGVGVDSSLIRSVHFQIDAGPALSWGKGPYSLAASNFVPTGLHTLKVIAEDRAGQTREQSFQIYADTNDPNVAHNIPARMFLGVPNKVPLDVSDDSNVTVSARMGDQVSSLTGIAGSRAYAPTITPTKLGNQLLEVRVEDVVGNLVRFVQGVDVVPLEVDVEVTSVKQTDQGAILNEDIQVTVKARQANGVIAIPVNVTFGGKDLGSFDVAASGTTTKVLSFRMQPGVYRGNLTLTVPAQVTELDRPDNSMSVTVEQFMARVIFRGDLFHIRAASTGLPDVAVAADGTTYPLTLKDRGLSTVHAFTVDGNELYWNPASLVTTVSEPDSSENGNDDRGIPGVPVVALLAALAGVGLLRRRMA